MITSELRELYASLVKPEMTDEERSILAQKLVIWKLNRERGETKPFTLDLDAASSQRLNRELPKPPASTP